MAGFRNAPSVTDLAEGMRIRRTPSAFAVQEWDVIVHIWREHEVFNPGDGLCERTGRLDKRFIQDYELDLESIWVGRQYRSIKEGDVHTIESLGREYFVLLDQDDADYSYPLFLFRKNYEPLPLPVPEPPVKVGDVVQIGEHMDSRAAYIGRLEWIGTDTVRIHNGKCLVEVSCDPSTITKLVPEAKP